MQEKQNANLLSNNGIRFYASSKEQELFRLKEAVNRTDEEKFYFLMHLMKMQQILKKGKVEFK